MRWCIIILIFLILIIAFVSIYLYLKYHHFMKNISNIGNHITTSFSSIEYPSSIPNAQDEFDINLSRLGISTVMSAINFHQKVNPLLPPYLKIAHALPQNYGIVLVPTIPSDFSYIIAFRGTLSHADVVSDLKWPQVEYYGLGKVHEGFAQIASVVYPYLNLPNNSTVLITGHSLGASVAEIVATRAAVEKKLKVKLYISARPRTGNLTWDNNVKRYTDRYILLNQSDDIPQLPLPTMVKGGVGYGYISPPVYRSIYFNFQSGNIGNNHDPLTYHYALYGGQMPFYAMWYVPLVQHKIH